MGVLALASASCLHRVIRFPQLGQRHWRLHLPQIRSLPDGVVDPQHPVGTTGLRQTAVIELIAELKTRIHPVDRQALSSHRWFATIMWELP